MSQSVKLEQYKKLNRKIELEIKNIKSNLTPVNLNINIYVDGNHLRRGIGIHSNEGLLKYYNRYLNLIMDSNPEYFNKYNLKKHIEIKPSTEFYENSISNIFFNIQDKLKKDFKKNYKELLFEENDYEIRRYAEAIINQKSTKKFEKYKSYLKINYNITFYVGKEISNQGLSYSAYRKALKNFSESKRINASISEAITRKKIEKKYGHLKSIQLINKYDYKSSIKWEEKGVDTKLTIDAVDSCYKNSINEISCIITNDTDFEPLFKRLDKSKIFYWVYCDPNPAKFLLRSLNYKNSFYFSSLQKDTLSEAIFQETIKELPEFKNTQGIFDYNYEELGEFAPFGFPLYSSYLHNKEIIEKYKLSSEDEMYHELLDHMWDIEYINEEQYAKFYILLEDFKQGK